MRSQLVLQGTITDVSQSSQCVEITDSNGVIHTQEIQPVLPDAVWLSTCGYLRGLGFHVIETESGDRITVIQPDVLIDVSEAASVVGTSYTGHLVRRLRTAVTHPASLEGSLINGIFDTLVQDPTGTDDDYVRRAIATRPLAMALVARQGRSDDLQERIRQSIPALRSMLEAWKDEKLDLEPFYMSPRWGLQGRADIIRRTQGATHIIEMKAGSVPSGVQAVRNDHAAQVAGYAAILGCIESDDITASVWYVKAADKPLRTINAAHLIGDLLRARNIVLLADLAIQRGSIAPLQWLGQTSAGGSSYEVHAVQDLRQSLTRCDSVEILAVRAWMSMAASLHTATRVGGNGQRSLSDVWMIPLEDKRSSPSVLTDLTIDHDTSDVAALHLTFHRPAARRGDTAIRVGDQILLYPQPSSDASPCDDAMYKGVVRDLTPTSISIAFRNKFIDPIVFDAPVWIIEQDVMDVSARALYTGLRSFVDADARRRNVLLGRALPHHGTPHGIAAPDCTPQQQQIIERALSADELMLIQGPPGTGKTSTVIRRIIQQLVSDKSERVLAVAYTNRAANELCSVLERNGIAYLRHGSIEGAEGMHAIPHMARITSPDVLAERIASAECIVATVQSMYSSSEIWEFGAFTTVIVDEASQILEPALLGITSRVPRSILVGDHCQLPPVITLDPASIQPTNQQLRALGLTSLDRSAFERLIACAEQQHDDASVAMLTQQGRMHADIMRVVSDAVYDGNLQTLLPWQLSPEATPWADVLPHRTVFVPIVGEDQAAAEAAYIVHLATLLHQRCEEQQCAFDLGIITPFRVQNARIREQLPDHLRAIITVDTVERFQGSERDIIIYGTAVSATSELSSIESQLLVHGKSIDRKLNVAITRARQQLVLVGNEYILTTSPAYRDVVAQLYRMPVDMP